jgi:hypothetical protein
MGKFQHVIRESTSDDEMQTIEWWLEDETTGFVTLCCRTAERFWNVLRIKEGGIFLIAGITSDIGLPLDKEGRVIIK